VSVVEFLLELLDNLVVKLIILLKMIDEVGECLDLLLIICASLVKLLL
jgi:hypothetical protein